MSLFLSRKRGWAIALALAAGAGAGLLLLRPAPAPTPPAMHEAVQFLPTGTRIPPQPVSWFERAVPLRWGWLWRARDTIRGPLATILVDCALIDCTALSDQTMSRLLPARPLAQTNGMTGWALSIPALMDLRSKLESSPGARLISSARVQMNHAIEARLSVGSHHPLLLGGQVGLTLELLPLIRSDGTELMALVTVTEPVTNRAPDRSQETMSADPAPAGASSIRTNLAAATRWSLPDGTGFFILGPRTVNDSKRLGVIVSPSVRRPPR